MLRRLYHDQPDSFAFTKSNLAWAKGQMAKYPEGRKASAIIPLLWRAQEQEGWLSKPAIEYVADLLEMAHIRALEVATFYFMFKLEPVGAVAHVQVCGTTSCMISGAEELISICKKKISQTPNKISMDGNLSWEEVECLGACANAPMVQIGKDYYEDLDGERLSSIIDSLISGVVPLPGSQKGRYSSEPSSGLTSLNSFELASEKANASVARARDLGDTIKKILGNEAELKNHDSNTASNEELKETTISNKLNVQKPKTLKSAKKGRADDLKKLKGVGAKLEKILNGIGIFHYDQISRWTSAELAWVDENIPGFKGAASRYQWVEQAKKM